jgi:hypothetical protein
MSYYTIANGARGGPSFSRSLELNELRCIFRARTLRTGKPRRLLRVNQFLAKELINKIVLVVESVVVVYVRGVALPQELLPPDLTRRQAVRRHAAAALRRLRAVAFCSTVRHGRGARRHAAATR